MHWQQYIDEAHLNEVAVGVGECWQSPDADNALNVSVLSASFHHSQPSLPKQLAAYSMYLM